MNLSIKITSTLLVFCLVTFNTLFAQSPISSVNRLVDNTNTLSELEAVNLNSMIAEIDRDHDLELAILMEPSIDTESLDDYAKQILSNWSGNPKSNGRGLILVAKDDRQVVISGDPALEGKLSEILKTKIIEEIIVPEFRGGRFSLGLEEGIDALEIIATGGMLSETSTFQIKNYPLMSIFVLIVILSIISGFVKSARVKLGIAFVVAIVVFVIFGSITHAILMLILSLFPLLSRSSRGGGGAYGGGYDDGSEGAGFQDGESSFSLGGGSLSAGGAGGDWRSFSVDTHKKFDFTPEQKEKVEQAVKDLELESSGEIVVYFARKSDSYFEGSWKLSALLALLGAFTIVSLSFVWLLPSTFSTMNIAWSIVLLIIAGMVIAYFFPAVRLAFVPLNVMDHRVVTKARDVFLQEEIFNTVERTGILIYISELEQRVQIIGDKGISAVILQDDWNHVLNHVTDGIKNGNPTSGLVDAIHACKKLLLDNGFIVRVDDTNELSDEMIIEK